MSRTPEVVLGEFAAIPVSIETHHKAVVIDANNWTVGSLAIAGGASRNNDVIVDGDWLVLRRVRTGRIASRSPLRVALAQPRCDDRFPAGDRLVRGVISVGDVFGEERCDVLCVVGQPCCNVSVEPGLGLSAVHGVTLNFISRDSEQRPVLALHGPQPDLVEVNRPRRLVNEVLVATIHASVVLPLAEPAGGATIAGRLRLCEVSLVAQEDRRGGKPDRMLWPVGTQPRFS